MCSAVQFSCAAFHRRCDEHPGFRAARSDLGATARPESGSWSVWVVGTASRYCPWLANSLISLVFCLRIGYADSDSLKKINKLKNIKERIVICGNKERQCK